MSEQQITDVARAQITTFNDKDWDAVRTVNAADVVYEEFATHRRIEGIEDAIQAFQGWASAFPDATGNIHDIFVADDTAVIELTWTGTHTGTLVTPNGDIPATNKPVEFRACQVVTIKDGRAKHVRHYFDLATMMNQLGVA